VGTAHAGRGGGARQGRTGGDAPRRRRDDGAERSARDGSVPVVVGGLGGGGGHATRGGGEGGCWRHVGAEKARWRGDKKNRAATASRGRSGREARALASEADGPILGKTGEVAACLSAGEKEQGKKGERDGGRRLLWRLGGAGGEERGQGGPGFGAAWRGKRGRERGPRSRRRGGGSWRPPSALDWRAVGLRRDRGGQRGMGDPSRARLTDGAGRRRGPVGSGGVREGVRGSEAVVASGC
jgi:hypothetical protein